MIGAGARTVRTIGALEERVRRRFAMGHNDTRDRPTDPFLLQSGLNVALNVGAVEQTVSTANRWRWHYKRPPEAFAPGVAAARAMRPSHTARQKKALRDQIERRRLTGFAGADAEAGHQVTWALLDAGYSPTIAAYGGHLVACGGLWNFQGNRRLGRWICISERSLRRARAVLEADGYLTSYLLMPGEMVPGQRVPVQRPQVVRHIEALRRLATVRSMARRAAPHKRSAGVQRPSAADQPTKPQATAADLNALAAMHPEFAPYLRTMATAAPKGTPSPAPSYPDAPSPEEIDEVERELHDTDRPPPRPPAGPPKRL
jgi:hypothetical protein